MSSGLVVERDAPAPAVGGESLVPWSLTQPRSRRWGNGLSTRPIRLAWVAPKNGSAAGERQSTSSRRPALSVRPSRPM